MHWLTEASKRVWTLDEGPLFSSNSSHCLLRAFHEPDMLHSRFTSFTNTIPILIHEQPKAQRGQWILFQVTALLRDRVRIGMQMSLTSQPPFFPLSWRWDLKDTDGLWIIEARGAMLTLSYPQRSTEISHTHTHTICCCHIPNVITPAEKHQAFSWRNFFLC